MVNLPVIFGQHILSRYYKKGFKDSYLKFKEKLDEELKDRAKSVLDELKSRLDSINVDEIFEILRDEACDLEIAYRPSREYLKLHNKIKWIYALLFSSTILAFFAINWPDYRFWDYLLSDWAFLFMIGGIALVAWTFFDAHKLERTILRYEMGTPIKRLIEEFESEKDEEE